MPLRCSCAVGGDRRVRSPVRMTARRRFTGRLAPGRARQPGRWMRHSRARQAPHRPRSSGPQGGTIRDVQRRRLEPLEPDARGLPALQLLQHPVADADRRPAVHLEVDGAPVATSFRRPAPFAPMPGAIRNGVGHSPVRRADMAALHREGRRDAVGLGAGGSRPSTLPPPCPLVSRVSTAPSRADGSGAGSAAAARRCPTRTMMPGPCRSEQPRRPAPPR